MEQMDAEAETSFLSRTFLEITENVTQTSVHYPYVHVNLLNIELLHFCFGKLCDRLYLSKPWRLTAKLLIQLTTRGLCSPCSYQSATPVVVNKAHSFRRHLCHRDTRHCCIPFYLVQTAFHMTNRLFAMVFSRKCVKHKS